MAGINGWEPQEGSPVLMSRDLFERYIELVQEADGQTLEVDYGPTVRGTVTYCEPTIYITDAQPDPLTIGQD